MAVKLSADLATAPLFGLTSKQTTSFGTPKGRSSVRRSGILGYGQHEAKEPFYFRPPEELS